MENSLVIVLFYGNWHLAGICLSNGSYGRDWDWALGIGKRAEGRGYCKLVLTLELSLVLAKLATPMQMSRQNGKANFFDASEI